MMDDNPHAPIRILRTRLPYAQFDMRPWSPPLNVFETDQAMLLVVALAGVDGPKPGFVTPGATFRD
jgi:HSP20 family molecular chaperone IbpA